MDHIVLNLGGQKFFTTKDTLLPKRDDDRNFFTGFFSAVFTRDEKGAFFIDRDGKYFEPVLTYLRTNKFVILKNLDRELLQYECEFYGVIPPIFQKKQKLRQFDILKKLRENKKQHKYDKIPKVTQQRFKNMIRLEFERALNKDTELIIYVYKSYWKGKLNKTDVLAEWDALNIYDDEMYDICKRDKDEVISVMERTLLPISIAEFNLLKHESGEFYVRSSREKKYSGYFFDCTFQIRCNF